MAEVPGGAILVVRSASITIPLCGENLMKTAAKLAIDEGCNKCTPILGTKMLRERVAKQVSARCGVSYSPDEIGITAGAKQALYNAAMVLFNPGDEAVIPQPYWVTFPAQVQLAGASSVFVDTARTGYQLTSEDLERALTAATKAVIINSPNNPTGVIYEPEALLRISQIALERKIWIIFDECYSELVRDGATHCNMVQLDEKTKGQTILINSFSKSHAVTGWRIGYACGPKHVISAMGTFRGHTTSNACTIPTCRRGGAPAGRRSIHKKRERGSSAKTWHCEAHRRLNE
jgi:aspartate aminotransferase